MLGGCRISSQPTGGGYPSVIATNVLRLAMLKAYGKADLSVTSGRTVSVFSTGFDKDERGAYLRLLTRNSVISQGGRIADEDPQLTVKMIRVCSEIRGEYVVVRFGLAREILGNELELLANATADNGVIAIESDCHALSVRGLLADEIVDQPFEFLARGRPLPRACEQRRKVLDLACGDDHRIRGHLITSRPKGKGCEERRPKQYEVKQWFLEQSIQSQSPGVNQIGEV